MSGRFHAVAPLGVGGLRRGHEVEQRAHRRRAASRPLQTPAEKVVTIWIAGGSVPTTSMPARCISSLSCWKPSSTSPRATSVPTGTPGGGLHEAVLDRVGDAPALEQLEQLHAARAGGVADAARRQHRPLDRILRADVRPRRAGAHRDGHAGVHQVDPAAGEDAAGGDQLVDRVGGQHHDVEGLAGLHAPGRIDAADRLDRDARARALLDRRRPVRPAPGGSPSTRCR